MDGQIYVYVDDHVDIFTYLKKYKYNERLLFCYLSSNTLFSLYTLSINTESISSHSTSYCKKS